ncbi:DNA mismatch repair protein [Eubacterium sp.]|uniref:MutS-related protein n=1 Tax=Eubacterium sp. TaxID=142586 RepID=UPI0025FDF3C5|nr:DNA mismatch repair protein [Eubacterium sp.]MCR5628913.1 DNA mismatch repair protein [Eubacterium sp.]
MQKKKISILYPDGDIEKFNELPDVTIHDLALDSITKKLTKEPEEQQHILRIMSRMSGDPRVTDFRCGVFDDIYHNKEMRKDLMVILEKINFLRSYGTFRHDYEESSSTWDLLHRLEEINDYIECVEAMSKCLEGVELKSEGLIKLKEYVDGIYNDNGFIELKKDIKNLRATTKNIKSVTLGINLNSRFEASEIGVVSINSKAFTKSGIIDNFHDKIVTKEGIKQDNKWNGDYKFTTFDVGDSNTVTTGGTGSFSGMMAARANPVMAASMANVSNDIQSREVTKYMDKITNRLLVTIVKKLRSVLTKYVTITITDITDLIPEFLYYIRWAEYIEALIEQGNVFNKAKVVGEGDECFMDAKGLYNLKLASFQTEEHENIVTNDLDFTREHLVYILTGANRGGKTTITQAVGLLFVLAQGGIYVPCEDFAFAPVDNIYTHFPADEDKTMDLGRLGEECKRFKEIYERSTKQSLLLLNETFSTTSFEEGFYIAKDAVKAIIRKGVRTIYNTHMHKLAYDIDEINADFEYKAASLVVKSDGGNRSYKVEVAPPQGMSYAMDIAKKYGVTYDMLMELGK